MQLWRGFEYGKNVFIKIEISIAVYYLGALGVLNCLKTQLYLWFGPVYLVYDNIIVEGKGKY